MTYTKFKCKNEKKKWSNNKNKILRSLSNLINSFKKHFLRFVPYPKAVKMKILWCWWCEKLKSERKKNFQFFMMINNKIFVSNTCHTIVFCYLTQKMIHQCDIFMEIASFFLTLLGISLTEQFLFKLFFVFLICQKLYRKI